MKANVVQPGSQEVDEKAKAVLAVTANSRRFAGLDAERVRRHRRFPPGVIFV